MVTRGYDPPTGFVARRDVLRAAVRTSYDWRPGWRPRPVRAFYPYLGTQLYRGLSDRRLQETFTKAYVDVAFQNGALVYPDVSHAYQRLTAPFTPVRGVTVAPGTYSAVRYDLYAASNASARLSGIADVSTGGYFDRTLDQGSLTVRAAPSPFAAAAVRRDVAHFRAGPPGADGRPSAPVTTHLVAPELRVALNPRVQATAFYQYNTDAARGALNGRVSWEFAPLSYAYLVVNDLRAAGPEARVFGPAQSARQVVLKLVWLRPL